MTPARQPHRQRCETCKHYNDETETEYGMCYAESGHREQMYNNTFDHVAKYGCASHSSATHTPAASAERLCDECNIIEVEDRLMELEQQVKAEREQVLDAIDKAIIKKEIWSRLELLAIIAEQKTLRGGGA